MASTVDHRAEATKTTTPWQRYAAPGAHLGGVDEAVAVAVKGLHHGGRGEAPDHALSQQRIGLCTTTTTTTTIAVAACAGRCNGSVVRHATSQQLGDGRLEQRKVEAASPFWETTDEARQRVRGSGGVSPHRTHAHGSHACARQAATPRTHTLLTRLPRTRGMTCGK